MYIYIVCVYCNGFVRLKQKAFVSRTKKVRNVFAHVIFFVVKYFHDLIFGSIAAKVRRQPGENTSHPRRFWLFLFRMRVGLWGGHNRRRAFVIGAEHACHATY